MEGLAAITRVAKASNSGRERANRSSTELLSTMTTAARIGIVSGTITRVGAVGGKGTRIGATGNAGSSTIATGGSDAMINDPGAVAVTCAGFDAGWEGATGTVEEVFDR